MKLPNRHLAYAPEAKITHYLLNVNHPDGWGKAQEFRNRGYNESNVDQMTRDLIAVAQSQPVSEVVSTEYGLKYVIYGMLQPPGGGNLLVLSVWMIDYGENAPRLVTAYPQEQE